MLISEVKRSIEGVTSLKLDAQQMYSKQADLFSLVKRADVFSSELELEYMLDLSNEKVILMSREKIVYVSKNLQEIFRTTKIFIDTVELSNHLETSDAFSLNFSIFGEVLSMNVVAYKKRTDRDIILLHVRNLPVFSFIKLQEDRTNCILCDTEMRILHISQNLVDLFKLPKMIGRPISEIGYLDITSGGTSTMYIGGQVFKVEYQDIPEEGTLLHVRKTVEDVQERRLWSQVSAWNHAALPYTVALVDITSLQLINVTNGSHFGDRCIQDLIRLLKDKDPSCFAALTTEGAVLLATHTTGLETRDLLEDLEGKTQLPYDFKFSTATSNEVSTDHVNNFSVFYYVFTALKTRLIYEKNANKNLSLATLRNIMFQSTPETKTHCTRIQSIANIIAEKFSISQQEKSELGMGALLHDIGKIFIPSDIVHKPGKLTIEEFETMKTHTFLGAEIFNSSKSLPLVRQIILYHHERYDGKGYPFGMPSKDLPISVSIVTLVDSVDAIISARCYKEAQPIQFAIEEILRNSGTQFHPKVVDAFIECYKEGKFDGLLNLTTNDSEPGGYYADNLSTGTYGKLVSV